MLINPISFLGKIPLGICKVKDIRQNKFVEAKCFELDCKDLSDIEQVKKNTAGWEFGEDIVHYMEFKNQYANIDTDYKPRNRDYFYAIEKDDEIIGISQVQKNAPELIVDFIESEHRGKYKYIGQNIINLLGKIALKEDYKRIYIPNPVIKARDFYVKKCNFKETKRADSVYLTQGGMKNLRRKMNRLG